MDDQEWFKDIVKVAIDSQINRVIPKYEKIQVSECETL